MFPDVPTAKELGWDVANGVWYLLMAERGIDVDYRPGEPLRADLWREYKLHTEILRRIGMLKN